MPLLPAKQSTLHGLQGKTIEPGLIAHWKFPPRLSRDSLWLARYVILSRVRRLSALLSFGLPQRSVLEGGPPEALTDALEHFVEESIAKTKKAIGGLRENRFALKRQYMSLNQSSSSKKRSNKSFKQWNTKNLKEKKKGTQGNTISKTRDLNGWKKIKCGECSRKFMKRALKIMAMKLILKRFPILKP